MAGSFFDAGAQQRIEAAVKAAEAGSLGQIVAVVVEKSDAYPEARLRAGIYGAMLGAGAALLLDRSWPLHLFELVLAQLGVGALCALLANWDPLERILARGLRMERAVRQRALRAFHEHDLHHTELGTGVLVFASLFERRAVVLGDHGIHAAVGDEAWREAVALLTAGMRRGDPAGGFEAAIGSVGEKLARHFPRGPGAPGNELPDALRVDRK
jgi:putative membrane protein